MPDLHWVGGTASANATAGTKWALTAGGAGGQPIPTASDDVYFDASSGAAVVTLTSSFVCKNLICTGFTGELTGTQACTIAAALLLVAGMTYTYTGTITFSATSGTNNITTAGKSIGGNFTFNGVGGTWQLQDALTITTGKGITLTNGIIDYNSKNVSLGNFVSNNSNVRSLLMSNSTVTLIDTGTVWNCATVTNFTLTTTGSTIIINNVTATSKTFAGGGKTYNTITVSGDNVIFTGANTISTLNVNTAGLTNGLILTAGVTQTITTFTTNGSVGNLAKLLSSSAGSPATISKINGTVSVDYMSIKDITASGGASFYAGANSTNVSGNSGWVFTAPPVPGLTNFFFNS